MVGIVPLGEALLGGLEVAKVTLVRHRRVHVEQPLSAAPRDDRVVLRPALHRLSDMPAVAKQTVRIAHDDATQPGRAARDQLLLTRGGHRLDRQPALSLSIANNPDVGFNYHRQGGLFGTTAFRKSITGFTTQQAVTYLFSCVRGQERRMKKRPAAMPRSEGERSACAAAPGLAQADHVRDDCRSRAGAAREAHYRRSDLPRAYVTLPVEQVTVLAEQIKLIGTQSALDHLLVSDKRCPSLTGIGTQNR